MEINGNNEPLVSVLMTAYNREIFIKESVESVIHSSYKNIELIIVDDGSSDNTIDVVKALMLNDKRIKLFQNENNKRDNKIYFLLFYKFRKEKIFCNFFFEYY